MNRIKHVIHALSQVQGLNSFYVLTEEDKKQVERMEPPLNAGVHEALKRQYVVCCTHDETFREPTQVIVKQKAGEAYFPPVSFPEVPAKNVVSSSPSEHAHEYLCEKMVVKPLEATLLIGFDID
ncbi:MAG: hypothetical protein HY393_01830 [Candidatus Diapherotrites archaeon]|nr:hypothetical protein [Candidatus Diapherotrites archaeon]